MSDDELADNGVRVTDCYAPVDMLLEADEISMFTGSTAQELSKLLISAPEKARVVNYYGLTLYVWIDITIAVVIKNNPFHYRHASPCKRAIN